MGGVAQAPASSGDGDPRLTLMATRRGQPEAQLLDPGGPWPASAGRMRLGTLHRVRRHDVGGETLQSLVFASGRVQRYPEPAAIGLSGGQGYRAHIPSTLQCVV